MRTDDLNRRNTVFIHRPQLLYFPALLYLVMLHRIVVAKYETVYFSLLNGVQNKADGVVKLDLNFIVVVSD